MKPDHPVTAPTYSTNRSAMARQMYVMQRTLVGAIGGAAVNLAFIEQYYGLARGHFTVRRLERGYGAEAVRAEYDQLIFKAGHPQVFLP